MNDNAFKRLTAQQWGFLLRAYLRLWSVQFRLKFGRASWLKQQITFTANTDVTSLHESSARVSGQIALAERIKESVRLAARLHLGQPACLPQSLVLAELLRKAGMHAEVKIGVQKVPGPDARLASHAWVEIEGVMVAEPESVAADFTRLRQLAESND